MFDGKAFGEEMVVAVRGYVDRATAPLIVRIAELEALITGLAAPVVIRPDEVKAMVDTAVDEAVAALPAPIAGKDADPEVIKSLVDTAVANAVGALPPPTNGQDADMDAVRTMVDEAVATIPPAKDGIGVAGAVIDRDGALILTLSDGTHRELGQVVGKSIDRADVVEMIKEQVALIPAPKDGIDGFGLDDFDAVLMDDGRTVLLSFTQGETKHSVELAFPAMVYRHVFKDDQEYQRGDVVTWAGSLWHCDAVKSSAKPGEGSADWTLAVKRGRDGKDTVKLA